MENTTKTLAGTAIAITLGAIVGPMVISQAVKTYQSMRYGLTTYLVAEYLDGLELADKTGEKTYKNITPNECGMALYVLNQKNKQLQGAITDMRDFLNSQPE